jgi:hypothetical protein
MEMLYGSFYRGKSLGALQATSISLSPTESKIESKFDWTFKKSVQHRVSAWSHT